MYYQVNNKAILKELGFGEGIDFIKIDVPSKNIFSVDGIKLTMIFSSGEISFAVTQEWLENFQKLMKNVTSKVSKNGRFRKEGRTWETYFQMSSVSNLVKKCKCGGEG